MKINVVIPAKGNSTRVQSKNLQEINGKPLIWWAVKKWFHTEHHLLDRFNIYVDTDCPNIKYTLGNWVNRGLKFIDRPVELANNNLTANDLMVYAFHTTEPCDLLLQSFCTSPFIKPITIDNALFEFRKNSNKSKDSFFTVTELREYYWNENGTPTNFDLDFLPNSQDLEPTLLETHGLYGIRPEALMKTKRRVGDNPLLVKIPKSEALDIDTYEDLKLARKLAKGDPNFEI